ncbi:hypothetical protein [Deinococcus sp.]|uniref:hypothetical protein n=1 Tax=Deinococcus sp. TaxID=47478 RepID=UPI003B5A9432
MERNSYRRCGEGQRFIRQVILLSPDVRRQDTPRSAAMQALLKSVTGDLKTARDNTDAEAVPEYVSTGYSGLKRR